MKTAERERGFALLLVLWSLVLLAFVATHLAAAGRTETRIASNLAANAAAAAAADGGVYRAIFALSDPQPEPGWALDGTPHQVDIGHSRMTLRVENEAARINPNLASPALVEALLRVVTGDRDRSAAMASAIAEWIGKARKIRGRRAAVEDSAADPDYHPPRAPLESLDELALVRGMTPDLLAMLRPHLTLLGPADPDPAGGDAVVAAALGVENPLAATAMPRRQTLTPLTVRIFATAHGPGNAVADRVAVARVSRDGFTLLAWERGGAAGVPAAGE